MVWYIRFLKNPKVDPKGLIRALITITTDLGDGFFPANLTLYAMITDEENWMSEWQILKWKSGMRKLWIDIVTANPWVSTRLVVTSEQNEEGNTISTEKMPEILDVWSDTFSRDENQAGSIIQRRYRTGSGLKRVIMEETGDSIARHVWDAGIALVAFLEKLVLQPGPISCLAELLQRSSAEGPRILELGSGCGITGLHIADLCFRSDVLLTDQKDAMYILSRNVELATSGSNGGKLATAVLDWEEHLPRLIAKQRFDLVVLSDCTYNSDSIPGLVKTLSSLIKATPDALIVTSLKKRHDSEAIFFDLMAGADFIVAEHTAIALPDRCKSENGQDLEVVEIYVYRGRTAVADG